jgi:catechol 2,3-dioxygenase-like lactoylglutathione lyase family enzyme
MEAQQISGFREIIFSVKNLDQTIQLYQEIGGYSLKFRGKMAEGWKQFWKLPPETTIEEAFLINEGDSTGFLRLVQFGQVPQVQIRPGGHCWDTGGIFDVDVRVLDIHQKTQQLQDLSWHAYSKPHRYTFGKFDVEEILMKGHDGVTLALIQRHAPPLQGWPNLRAFSYMFNSTQVVRNFDEAVDFYQKKLGFQPYLKTESISAQPEENVLGVPRNLTTQVKRKVAILHPQGTNVGSVELIQIEGLEGEHYADRALPPNLGILTLRFPVRDLAKLQERLRQQQITLWAEPRRLWLPPYGWVQVLAVRSPEGAILEFFEEETVK